jgi:ketosteroid isomerase-like protein
MNSWFRKHVSPICGAVIVSALLAACADMAVRSSETDARNAILARSRAFSAAYLRNDNDAIGELYTADATLLSPSREVRGRDEARKVFLWGPQYRQIEHSLRSTSLEIRGDVAVDVGTSATASQRVDNPVVHTNGLYMVVWVREADGAWRIKYDMWHRVPPL